MRPFLSVPHERFLLQIADVLAGKLRPSGVSFNAAVESALVEAALIEKTRGGAWISRGREWGPYRLTAKGLALVRGLQSIEPIPPPAPQPEVSFRDRIERFLGKKLTRRACPFCGHKPVDWQPLGPITVPLGFMGCEPAPMQFLAVMCAECAAMALFPTGAYANAAKVS